MKHLRDKIGEEAHAKLWEVSDDAMLHICTLSELYGNVPKDLQDCKVVVEEFHQFDDKDRDKVMAWLNRDKSKDSKPSNIIIPKV